MIDPTFENSTKFMHSTIHLVIDNLNNIHIAKGVSDEFQQLMLGVPAVLLRLYLIKELTEMTIAKTEKEITDNQPDCLFAISQGKEIAKRISSKIDSIMISGNHDQFQK